MSFTRPEGVAIVSKATEPTTRMLMSLHKSVGGRWSLVVGFRVVKLWEIQPHARQRPATNDQRLFQILSQYQLQLLFRRRRNLRRIRQNGMRQCMPALTCARLRH